MLVETRMEELVSVMRMKLQHRGGQADGEFSLWELDQQAGPGTNPRLPDR